MKKWIVLFILFITLGLGASPVEKVLVDQEIEVLRADFKELHFLVPEMADKSYEFKVNFQTKGGFNDDIIFLVLNQENYVRWFSKYDFKAVAKTEKVTKSEFSVKGKPGQTYYFVMDNFFSGVSNKKVKLKIIMTTT